MADQFPDALDRMEINSEDITEFGTLFGLLDKRMRDTETPSPVQTRLAERYLENLNAAAASVGMKISSHLLREGRNMVRRTTLRDARGRFVARGGQRVAQYLREEISF